MILVSWQAYSGSFAAQWSKNIVLVCVVLHNILIRHQGGLDRASKPADDKSATANEATV